jgi:transposase
MTVPQEIEDEEHEQVLERVAAVDVAKSSGMVCTRVPHPDRPGKRRTTVREVSARTGAVLALAEDLAGEGIEMVHPRGDVGLLADLVLPAGVGWAEGAAGECT